MTWQEHHESKRYYPDELQFQENSEFTALDYERDDAHGARQNEESTQTAF